MRQWRVGTVSMGLSLIMLGIFLFLSLLNGYEVFQTFLAWWPLILIVLGLEITVYTLLPKNKEALLKYDFISIFFVGIIGTVGIAMTVLTSTGIIEGIQHTLTAERTTITVERADIFLDNNVKRIVLKTDNRDVTIEGSTSQNVSVFGTYGTSVAKGEKEEQLALDDYLIQQKSGDTLYLFLKDPRETGGLFASYSSLKLTVVVPSNVSLEVEGSYNSVSINPGILQNDWIVKGVRDVNIMLNKENDVEVTSSASNMNGNVEWEIDQWENGFFKIGEGTYSLQLLNASHVKVNMLK
jgi:hypothetical protein